MWDGSKGAWKVLSLCFGRLGLDHCRLSRSSLPESPLWWRRPQPAWWRARYVGVERGDMLCWHLPVGQTRLRKPTGPQTTGSPGNLRRGEQAGGQEMGRGKNDTVGHEARPEPDLPVAPLVGFICACLPAQDNTYSTYTHTYSTLISFSQPFHHSLYLYCMWPCAIFTLNK